MSWLDATGGDVTMSAVVHAGVCALAKLATSKKHAHVRQECLHTANHIQAQAKKSHEDKRALVDANADKYFLALKLACETGSSKLMCLALDIMQKLIALGYLNGSTVADSRLYPNPNPHARAHALAQTQIAESAQGALPTEFDALDLSLASLTPVPSAVLATAGSDDKLVAVMIDLLYQCSGYKDQQAQLLVLKCILTCVTSSSCGVHGWSLLQAVSACFQIYLANPTYTNNAGEEINRVTAKATLTQIFSLTFQRMEHFSQQLSQMHLALQQAETPRRSGEEDNKDVSVTPEPSTSPLPTPSPDSQSTSAMPADQPPHEATGSTLRPPVHPSGAAAPVVPGRHGLCVSCGRAANHYCLHTQAPVCGMECKLAHLKRQDPESDLTRRLLLQVMVQLELCQSDAYYLLRSMCRLAVKAVPAATATDRADVTTIGVDSKILSLHLLLSVLSSAGPTFRTTKHFIACATGDLVNCILRNSAASSIDTVFALSSSLFVSLVCNFKPHLHSVIGPVLDSIYLPYIASPNSTFELKYISLTVLHKIALDPQSLLEVFINYDARSLGNTFEKMATTLEKVCRSRFVSENWLSTVEEARLRLLALEALVDTIQSLLTWTKQAQATILANKDAAEAALVSLSADGYESEDADAQATPLAASSRSGRTPTQRQSSSASTPSSVASEDAALASSSNMQQFHAVRAQKQKLDTGCLKFNMKPKKGLAYLESHGLLQPNSPLAIAEFFLTSAASLDKVQVGEFLGEEDHKLVLYSYVEQLDFRGLSFDEAIRKFLNGFWLPGEAQKIDRMMEKFAEQYHKHNPGNFSTADTAYVLAYSVIMLNTDAHSPNVKYRMTKEDFFKNNRGIDDGKDIDPVFLGEVYEGIVNNEIKMKDQERRAKSGKEVMKRDRINMFLAESEELVRKTQDYLNFQRKHELEVNGGASSSSSAVSAPPSDGASASSRRRSSEVDESRVFQQATETDIEAVRPIFDILWYPSLATFSVLLEEIEGDVDVPPHASAAQQAASSQNLRIIELCLDGYRHSIRLSSALGIETSRLAFVTSLRKLTLLGSTREMSSKSVEAIKMLLLISHTEGNHLRESWVDVLECISELERLHLFATSRPIADVFQSSPARTRESDSVNSIHATKIDASSIDRVFTSSAHLDSDAIVDFVKALRSVSERELSNVNAPRVFSLQKLIEITYYNMGRIRVVWSKIWSVLSAYFMSAGCHPNLNVSMYAIDSLRQLAVKFLDKPELASFQFQKQFFRPFELIMINNHSNETRELIIQCMHRMVVSRVHNIKSGWKGVFVCIHTAASQTYQPLVVAAFELLSNIMDQHFALLTTTTDTFDECTKTLIAFGCNNVTAISLRAIHYLTQCCDHLGAQQVLRRERLAARVAQAEVTADSADAHRTPVRSRGASTSTPTNELSVSLPASPIITVSTGEVDELDMGLLSATMSTASAATPGEMQSDLRVWFLCLTGLSRMVLDPRLEVRSRALLTLFKILAAHGSHFSASTWRAVFCGVLFPIFDDVRHSSDSLKKRTQQSTAGGSNSGSESTTPVAWEDARASSAARGWSATHHVSTWRNQVNWSWPAAGSSTPRLANRPSPAAPSAATAATHSRESSAPAVNGIASVTNAAAAHVPTSLPVTRSIPALPPKPPTNPRLPSTPAPVPVAARARTAAAPTPENSWLQTTCLSALSALVELFDHFYSSVSFMLPDLLSLIHSCISQESEDLARIGIRCLTMLLGKVGSKLSIASWWTALESIAEIVQRTMPCELTSHKLRVLLGLTDADAAAAAVVDDGAAESNSQASSRAGSRRNSSAVAPGVAAAIPLASSTDVKEDTPTTATGASTPTPLVVTVATPTTGGPPSPMLPPPSPARPSPGVSVGIPAAAASPVAAPVLPFSSGVVVGKFRVQLQLLEALFQITDSFFPSKSVEQSRERGAFAQPNKAPLLAGAELDFRSAGSEEVAGHHDDVSLASTDAMVLGSLTTEQLFFALDLLSSTLSFARAFNLNLALRRKLYRSGFQTEQTALGLLPQLFLQETRATRLYVHLLFRLVREGGAGETLSHEQSSMDGTRWLQLQSSQGEVVEEETAPGGGTIVQSSYAAYVRLGESRLIGLSLRFLADYVSKTVSGQLVSLEFSEELLCGFIENLHRLASVSPARFQNYVSIFYLPLVQLISFGKEQTRAHLGLLFQAAVPTLLPCKVVTPFALHQVNAPTIAVPAYEPAQAKTNAD